MKKFIFSAVAMIAFVGSSMANTSEVKEVEILLVEKSCKEKAMDYVDGLSGTDSELYAAYHAYLAGCNDATKKTKLQVSHSFQQ